MRNLGLVFGALVIGGAITPFAPALAQTAIGGAIVAKNDVTGQNQGRTKKVAEGDRVHQNEIVRTGADSLANLVLLDDTNVALGPSSRITLDKFVYDPDAGAKKVMLNAASGAFRFISGRAPHEAYEVKTPTAIIGVRGTTYDVRVEPGRTRVVLQEGAVRVCRHDRTTCIELTEPGESADVTNRGVEGPIAPGGKTWDFGSLCGGPIDPCAHVTKFALNDTNPVTTPPRAQRTRVVKKVEQPSRPPRRAVVVRAEAQPEPPPRRVRPQGRYEIVEIERPRREPPRRRVAPVNDDAIETIYVRPRPVVPHAVVQFGVPLIGAVFPGGGGYRPGGKGGNRGPVIGGRGDRGGNVLRAGGFRGDFGGSMGRGRMGMGNFLR